MDEETYSTDGAECPYCGHMNAACDSDGQLYNEAIDEWDCGSCSKPFRVSVYVSHSWTCTPYEDLRDAQPKGEA